MLIMWRLPQLHGDPLPIVQQMIHQMIHRKIDSSKLAPLHWKRETRALLNERLPGRWIGSESERDDGDVSFIVRNDDATAIVTTTTVANTAFDEGDVSFINGTMMRRQQRLELQRRWQTRRLSTVTSAS